MHQSEIFSPIFFFCDKIFFGTNTISVRGGQMIQDLGERRLYNQFEHRQAEPEDRVFVFNERRQILVREEQQAGGLTVPKAACFAGRELQ